jgi:hypothetical protein
MASITIDVGGIRVATMDLAGLQVANVSIHGALDRDPKAALDAMGGDYADGGRGFLVWVAERALRAGEAVCVTLRAAGGDGDRGRTIAELFPDAEPSARTDFTISADMAAELRARARLHEHFIVRAEVPAAAPAEAASDDRNTDFSFSVLWNSHDPDRARVRLATHCLDDVLARTDGTTHAQGMLAVGDSARFVLVQ